MSYQQGLLASVLGNSVCSSEVSRVLSAYYRGRDHPGKMRLWGWIRRAQRHRPLIIPYSTQGRIAVEELDLVQREILTSGYYEPEVWEAARPFITADQVVWDIGAHVGSFSIRAALEGNALEVHSFEPNPDTCLKLRYNLALNRGTYIVHQCALSNQAGSGSFFSGPSANVGISSLLHDGAVGDQQVNCETADHLVFDNHVRPPSVMKIDVEGWELPVLEGARKILKGTPPRVIVFEADPTSGSELFSFIRTHGYEIEHIKRKCGETESRENYLAVLRRRT